MSEIEVDIEVGDLEDGLGAICHERHHQKRYPVFLVASYFEDKGKHDKIRLIVEIGSLQTL
jgi:hypothetical protein